MSGFDPKRTWQRVTNGTIPRPKCDILLEPDAVLGAGEAMRRREFIALAGCTTATWPFTAYAQQPVVPTGGYLSVNEPEQSSAASKLESKLNFMRSSKEGRKVWHPSALFCTARQPVILD